MHDDPARVSPAPTLGGLLSAVHAQRRRWGSAARHAAALSRPVRGGVGQLDAVAASQPAAMADGCVAQHVGQVAGNGRMLLVHNSMLKPSRSIKMLTFMLLAAVGRLDGDKRLEERRRNCCKGCA